VNYVGRYAHAIGLVHPIDFPKYVVLNGPQLPAHLNYMKQLSPNDTATIRCFVSNGKNYHKAFNTFTCHYGIKTGGILVWLT